MILRKEIFRFLATSFVALLLVLLLLGLDSFDAEATLDINIYDTYFVISKSQIIPLLFVMVFFVLYFFHVLRWNFKNLSINLIFLLATILFILVLGKTIAIMDVFNMVDSNGIGLDESNIISDVTRLASNMLFIIQILLLILLAYSGFKIGRNYKLIS